MKSVLIFDPQMESYLTKWMLQQTPFMVRTPIAKELMPAYVKKKDNAMCPMHYDSQISMKSHFF